MPVILALVEGVDYPEVQEELRRQWPDHSLWNVDPARVMDYGHWLREEWTGADHLVIVEHDVVPPPCSINALLQCSADWCAHPIWLGDHFSERTLGLVKFSRRLQQRWPGLLKLALPQWGEGRSFVHWRSVDSAIMRVLDFHGEAVHIHRPPARHIHKYPESPPAGPASATPGLPA